MIIDTTIGEICERCDWMKVCEVMKWNEWCLNEGLAYKDDKVTLTEEQAKAIGFIE